MFQQISGVRRYCLILAFHYYFTNGEAGHVMNIEKLAPPPNTLAISKWFVRLPEKLHNLRCANS